MRLAKYREAVNNKPYIYMNLIKEINPGSADKMNVIIEINKGSKNKYEID